MKVGFIGTGSMGSMLIESFIRSQTLKPDQIIASNRSKGKVDRLADIYGGLIAADSNQQTARESELLFICVKPHEYKKVIDEIRAHVRENQIVISITSPIMIELLEEQLPAKIAKIIPSITNRVCSGVSLYMYGSRITPEDSERIELLLRGISEPLSVSEMHTRIVSDLSSCGPAFIAYFLKSFIDAAVAEKGIDEKTAIRLASAMLLGTGKLLTDGGFTPNELQARVAVPGGITAEGLKLLQERLDGVFNELIQATHQKYYEEQEKNRALFNTTGNDARQ